MVVYRFDDFMFEVFESGNYWIVEIVILVGRVWFLENVSVWFGVVLRGDMELIIVGYDSNV